MDQYPSFKHVAPTKEPVEFINLASVDLSHFLEGPEGLQARQKLAKDLEEACRTHGFFFIEGTNYPQDKVDRLFNYGQALCTRPQDEIEQYLAGSHDPTADLNNATKDGAERAVGYKQTGYWKLQKNTPDSISFFNYRWLLHPDAAEKSPLSPFAKRHLPEVADYFNHIHLYILPKLCALFDIILEVPSGTSWSFFSVDQDPLKSAGGVGRVMLYEPMPMENEAKTSGTWLRGHSDGNALTFLTSQPMASLQVRDYGDGQWKYVDHRPGGLVVNIGDCFEFLTGSYFKSTIHRVVAPPKDQRGYRRMNLAYFCYMRPAVIIDPESYQSPKLKRLGYRADPEWKRITAQDWVGNKGKTYGKAALLGDDSENSADKPKAVLLHGRPTERWHQKP